MKSYTNRFTFKSASACLSIILAALSTHAAAPFERNDYGPGTATFRERFLGNYGINAEIEPSMQASDRPLYEKIAPLLASNPGAAIRIVENELNADSNPAFYFLLGSLYYQTNNFTQAEKHLKTAIAKFPEFRRAYRTLGLIYVQNGRYGDSIQYWLKVITLGGGDAQSYGLLGYSYLAEQKYQSALSAYEMARMFNPDSTDFRRGQAQCLLETGQSLRAIALFEELINESPETADYWLLQANALIELERYDEAMNNLEVVDSLGAGNTASRLLLGNLYLRAENQSLALAHYKQAIERDPNPDFARALQPLNYLIARNLLDEAESYLGALKQKLPSEPESAVSEGITLAEAEIAIGRGAYDVAQQLLAPLTEANPLNGDALIRIAEVALQAKDYPAAELYLERAQSIPGKEADALIALGRLEVDRGNLQKALNYLRSAQDIKPSSQIARYIESIERAI